MHNSEELINRSPPKLGNNEQKLDPLHYGPWNSNKSRQLLHYKSSTTIETPQKKIPSYQNFSFINTKKQTKRNIWLQKFVSKYPDWSVFQTGTLCTCFPVKGFSRLRTTKYVSWHEHIIENAVVSSVSLCVVMACLNLRALCVYFM